MTKANEIDRLQSLKVYLYRSAESADGGHGFNEDEQEKLNYLKNQNNMLTARIQEVENVIGQVIGDALWRLYLLLVAEINDTLTVLFTWRLPEVKSRFIELTDGGPGVGVNNIDVRVRTAEIVRIHNFDYYIRHHLANSDSSQNDVEGAQSYIGDAISDGAALKWEHFTREDMLKDLDESSLTAEDLVLLEMSRMEKNCWAVCNEVALRIDGSPGPHCIMKGFIPQDKKYQFFHDKITVDTYFGVQSKVKKNTTPGHSYYSKLEKFINDHFLRGQKYLEYVRGACHRAEADTELCEHCSKGWRGPIVHRVPQPIPDQENPGHFMDVQKTQWIHRSVDDHQPRVQMDRLFQSDEIDLNDEESVKRFAIEYCVDEALVRKRLEHLIHLKRMKEKKKTAANEVQHKDSEKQYDDYQWEDMFQKREIPKQKVKVLDKFLIFHGKDKELQMNKKSKIKIVEAIIATKIAQKEITILRKNDSSSSDSESENENTDIEQNADSDSDIVLTTYSSSSSDDEDINKEMFKSRSGRSITSTKSKDYVY